MPTRDQSRLSLVLTKELIDSHDVELLVEWLNSLSSSAESVFRYRDSLRLSITGFDVPIPAMHPNSRMFFRRLSKRWPYWLHFMERSSAQVQMLLCLLTDVEKVQANGGRKAFRFKDMDKVQSETLRLCKAATELIETHGLGVAAMGRMSGDVLAVLREMFGE